MSEADQSGAGRREVAYRVFASEYDDADFGYSASDEERAPNYVITPTGARANRLFVVGVLTEVEPVNDEMLRARVVDPTGAFVVYAGQYQPDEMAALERLDPPTYVAVTGKARTFQPDDADTIYTSIRPESVSEVDAETRDRWTVQTAERTLDRVAWMGAALESDDRGESLRARLAESGVDDGIAEGIALAVDHYGTTGEYLQALRGMVLDAARLVAGDIDEVKSLVQGPEEGTTGDLSAITNRELAKTDRPQKSTQEGGESSSTGTKTEAAAEATSSGAEAETVTISESEPAESSEETANEAAADTTVEETASGETPTGSEGEPVTTPEPEEGELPQSPTPAESADSEEFDPEEFELDDEEREEIEAEYGTEFQTGTEVDEPGEAGIEPSEPDEEMPGEADTEPPKPDEEMAEEEPPEDQPEGDVAVSPEEARQAEPETGVEPDSDRPTGEKAQINTEDQNERDERVETDSEDATVESTDGDDVDLENAAVEVMEELDDGDGVSRETVIETVVDEHDTDQAAVEDAIQDALMDGRCYEPNDDTLKPI